MHDVPSGTSEIASQRLLSEAASETPVMTSYSAGTATASMYTADQQKTNMEKISWNKNKKDELKASDADASSGVSHKQVQQTTNRQRSKKVKVKSKQTLCTLCLLKSYTANHTIFKSLASECKKSEARGNFESQPQPCQWSEDAFEIKHCEGF